MIDEAPQDSPFEILANSLLESKPQPTLESRFLSATSHLALTQDQLTKKLAELNRMRFQLSSLIDHISQGLIFIDHNGLLTTLSQKAQDMLGLEPLTANYSYQHYFKDDFFGFSIDHCLTHLTQAPPTVLTISSNDPNQANITTKRPKYLEITSCFINLENKALSELSRESNGVVGLLILVRDISELERLQAINQRNERLKELGELASVMAHEIRNPLAAIEGFASLLKRDIQHMPQQFQMMQSIIEASRSINKLVSNVLHYARPLIPDLYYQPLNSTIEHAIEMALVSGWIKQNQKLLFHAQKVIYASYDKELLTSSLLNLIRNALQAIENEGIVDIKIHNFAHEVEIQVIDNGIGIESSCLDKIFLPLFTTKTEGNGLGLCEVNKMIQAQGGRVEVISSVGYGSTFSIKLPL